MPLPGSRETVAVTRPPRAVRGNRRWLRPWLREPCQCMSVSSPVRSKLKPPRRHLTRGRRDERCPQWLSVSCSIRPEDGTERLGNRCSIRLSYGATSGPLSLRSSISATFLPFRGRLPEAVRRPLHRPRITHGPERSDTDESATTIVSSTAAPLVRYPSVSLLATPDSRTTDTW